MKFSRSQLISIYFYLLCSVWTHFKVIGVLAVKEDLEIILIWDIRINIHTWSELFQDLRISEQRDKMQVILMAVAQRRSIAVGVLALNPII